MQDTLGIVRSFRYVTVAHVAHLLGEPKDNSAKRLRRLEAKNLIRHFSHGGRNVYTCEPKNPRFIDHELLVTDFLAGARPAAVERTGLQTPHINPDALYLDGCWWYLEAESEAGRASKARLIEKCWQYLRHKRPGGFRVMFCVPARMVEPLRQAIQESGIRHQGKFAVTSHPGTPGSE